MDQITFALKEIGDNSGASGKEVARFGRLVEEHRQRMRKLFPNYDLFITGTGQSYGLKIEGKIIDSFSDLSKNTKGSDFDAQTSLNEKIEIKSVKALQGKSSDYIGARIVNLKKKTKLQIGGSFQQVKPTTCDWFLFHILYGDAERLFLVPSKLFSSTPKKENKEHGKLLLSAQHRNHSTEGQANIGQILSRAEYFELDSNYSSANVGTYSFNKFKKEVVKKLNRLGPDWILPD